MKKKILIAIIICVGLFLGSQYCCSKLYLEKHISPDSEYELFVQNESFFSSTLPGDGGTSRPVKLVLKNKYGQIIGKTNSNCSILWFCIEVDWDIENSKVWFAKGHYINLKTGKSIC